MILLLLFQVVVFAKSIGYKKETTFKVVSFLYQKNNDSILKNKYLTAKKLYENKEYSKSLKLGLTLLDTINSNDELKYLTSYLIGNVFRKINNQTKALIYYKRSFNFLSKKTESFIEENIRSYDELFEAEKYFADNLLKLGAAYQNLKKNDSATYYYKKIIEKDLINIDAINIKASAYANLSILKRQDSLYVEAKEYALYAIKIHRDNNNKIKEAASLNNLADIHIVEGDYVNAGKIYSRGLALIENNKNNEAIKYKEALYFNLAYALYKLKDYKAYEFQEKSYIIQDDLRDKEMRRIVEGIYANYQEEYKVELVKNQVALKKAEEQRTAWFFGILSFLVIISSGFIVYNYKLRQNNLKLKLDQTKLAQKSRLEKLRSDSQVRILNATLDGKETERKQIAETLHDSVSSLLSSANLHLQATKMQFNGDTPIEIDKTQKIILEASQTIRDLSHALVSAVLLKFGLKYAIKDMAEKYSNSQIQINTDIKNLRRYHQSFEIKVNNIIQEFVNNILKHSNASKAIVRVEDKNGKLIISIQDNGCGFDKNKIPEKDGLGINQIDARIQMMKGVFNIDSNAENGTKINVILPILEKEGVIHV